MIEFQRLESARRAVARELLVGAALLCVAVPPAFAQTAGNPESAADQEGPATEAMPGIVVTGSRIRGVAPVGSNVIGLGEEDIQASGAASASDVLRQIPQVTSLSINAEGATGQGASSNITRASGPNLRGLGQTATLVVLDGARVPTSGTQGNFVDPSFLPTVALQRLEVVADGASAIYGSDAVAGVINMIPRKNFTGAEMRIRGGFADSYNDFQASGIAGIGWKSGHLVVAAEWSHNDELRGTDRSYVSADRRGGGGSDSRTTACSRATITTGGRTYAVPASASGVLDFSTLTAGTANRCETEKLGFLIPEQERVSLYGYLTQDLGDVVRFYTQGFYSKREFSGAGGGQPTVVSITVPTTNAFYPTNAPSTPITVSTNFLDTVGPRQTEGTSKTFQVLSGFEASLGRWVAQLTASYGESFDEERRGLEVLNSALTSALASSDPARAINPFGTTANDPALIRSVYLTTFNPSTTNRLRTVGFQANGPLFALPGGDVRLAAGAEYRDERLSGTYVSGSVLAPTRTPTDISRDSKAVFGELYVPVFGQGNASAGFQQLSLVAAVRHENYSDFGATTNPKLGVNWVPVDGLTLRGSYGTSFRAPGLAEIDPNSSGAGIRMRTYSVAGRTLPLNIAVLAAGNPGLQPETANTWSAGADLAPKGVPGLRLSATYFNVTYKGQVVDAYTIVPQLLAEPANFQNIVFLNDGSARYQQAVAFLSGTPYYTAGSINFAAIDGIIDARKQNLGTTKADGLDLEAVYQFSAGSSNFSLSGNATLFLNYENSTGIGALVDRLNTYGYPQRFRARGSAGWSSGGLSTLATVNYLNAYKNATSTLVRDVSSYTTVDLDIGYSFGPDAGNFARGMRIGLNARNLFDRDPPFVDAGLGYDPSSASALGRVVSITLSKKW